MKRRHTCQSGGAPCVQCFIERWWPIKRKKKTVKKKRICQCGGLSLCSQCLGEKRKPISEAPVRREYKVVILDIDSSTFNKYIKAYSFEDALTRARGMYQGYTIKSVEMLW